MNIGRQGNTKETKEKTNRTWINFTNQVAKFDNQIHQPLNTNFLGNTVKLVYNDHPRDPEFVAVVDRWSLFRGSFML